MKTLIWNEDKNERLKIGRGVSFEDAENCLEQGKVLDVINHPNQLKHEGQKVFILEIRNYAYLVPFIEFVDEIILITMIPSRKMTKKYLREK